MIALPTLDKLNVSGKTVLVRSDLNVPMEGGRVTDATRINRLLPTLAELSQKGAKVVILSHFGRPKGKFDPAMSLAPLVDALAEALGKDVRFGVDCIGPAAREAVAKLQPGEFLLLENLRFHAEEESGDINFARELASLGDIYVNDAFSCSHRAHASITGVPQFLPFAAGRLLQQEAETLDRLFSSADRPLTAVVGGSKISTKLELLDNLIQKVDILIIGGAMANTFLHAQGYDVGKSICEKEMHETARNILARAENTKCEIVLPVDLIVTEQFRAHTPCHVVNVDAIPPHCTATDVGPLTVHRFAEYLQKSRTAVWNGPVGAFETSPFDTSTNTLARHMAALTRLGKLISVAGGGDTVAALTHAGLADEFTYLSTAGGAFLEWLEGKTLPGIAALLAHSANAVAV